MTKHLLGLFLIVAVFCLLTLPGCGLVGAGQSPQYYAVPGAPISGTVAAPSTISPQAPITINWDLLWQFVLAYIAAHWGNKGLIFSVASIMSNIKNGGKKNG